jgi:predicted ATPase
MNADRHRVLALVFSCHLAEALALRGDFDSALACVDAALVEAESEGRRYRLPEIMRIKGDILAATPNGDEKAAEAWLHRSLTLAREQSALAWELLATLSLARLWRRQRRFREARAALEGVYACFAEGFETADLVAARALLGSPPATARRAAGKT